MLLRSVVSKVWSRAARALVFHSRQHPRPITSGPEKNLPLVRAAPATSKNPVRKRGICVSLRPSKATVLRKLTVTKHLRSAALGGQNRVLHRRQPAPLALAWRHWPKQWDR